MVKLERSTIAKVSFDTGGKVWVFLQLTSQIIVAGPISQTYEQTTGDCIGILPTEPLFNVVAEDSFAVPPNGHPNCS